MIISPKIEKQIILNVFNKKKYYFEELFTLTNIAIGSFILFIMYLFFSNNNSIDHPYVENQYSNPKNFDSVQNSTETFEKSIETDKTIPKEEKNEILEYVNEIKKTDKEIYDLISKKDAIIKLLKQLTDDKEVYFRLDEISNGILNNLKDHFELFREKIKDKKSDIKKLEDICNKQSELINKSKELFAKIVILLKRDDKLFSKMYNQHFGRHSYDTIKNLYNYSIKKDVFYFKASLSKIRDNDFKIEGIFPTNIYDYNLSFEKIKDDEYKISFKEIDNQYIKTVKKYDEFLEIINSGKIQFEELQKKEDTKEPFSKIPPVSLIPSDIKPIISNQTIPPAESFNELRENVFKLHNSYKEKYDLFLEQSKKIFDNKNKIENKDELNKIIEQIEKTKQDSKSYYERNINEIEDKNLRAIESSLEIHAQFLNDQILSIELLISNFIEEKNIDLEKQSKIIEQIENNYSYIKEVLKRFDYAYDSGYPHEIDKNSKFYDIIKNYDIDVFIFLKNFITKIQDDNTDNKKITDYCDEFKAFIDYISEKYREKMEESPIQDYDDFLLFLKDSIKKINNSGEKNLVGLHNILKKEKEPKIEEINNKIIQNVDIFKNYIRDTEIENVKDKKSIKEKLFHYGLFFVYIDSLINKYGINKEQYEAKKTLSDKLQEILDEYDKFKAKTNFNDLQKILNMLIDHENVFKKIINAVKDKKTNENNTQIKKKIDEQERKQIKKIKAEINSYIKDNVSIFNYKINHEDYNILNYNDF
jgi:hypothetical protein